MGADDYMTKPFSPRELMARIQAMMRRPRTSGAVAPPIETAGDNRIRTFGDLTIDIDGREVTVGGTQIPLTRTEFDVLAALSRDPGVVVSRTQLIGAVWGPTGSVTSTSSTSISDTYAANSATKPPVVGTCAPSAVSATEWEQDIEYCFRR